MSKTVIDKDKMKIIIQKTYKEIRIKEKSNATKGTTISNIVKMVEETLKDGN